jgi:hypothetical protein
MSEKYYLIDDNAYTDEVIIKYDSIEEVKTHFKLMAKGRIKHPSSVIKLIKGKEIELEYAFCNKGLDWSVPLKIKGD